MVLFLVPCLVGGRYVSKTTPFFSWNALLRCYIHETLQVNSLEWCLKKHAQIITVIRIIVMTSAFLFVVILTLEWKMLISFYFWQNIPKELYFQVIVLLMNLCQGKSYWYHIICHMILLMSGILNFAGMAPSAKLLL